MKKQTKLGLVIAAAAVLTVSVASLVSARGWVQDGADWHYVDNDGEYITETMQSSGNTKFYLDENGNMAKDYFLEDYNGATYYFGSNGAMVTNTWVAIESSRVENQDDYVPDNYWYYFQASGKAMKGSNGSVKKTTIDGKKYAFNEYGQMCTGWVGSDGKTINPDDDSNPFVNATYYAGGDNDGVLRAGWVTYYDGYSDGEDWLNDKTNLYFYFNTTNNKKIPDDGNATTKKINGKTYAFTNEGVMISGWDYVNGEHGEGADNIASLAGKAVYFSGEDDGHQVKKGWVYAVPAESIDKKAYDDGEEKYMYFNASGDAVYDSFKKVNGKYYVFNAHGIMKTGMIIWNPNNAGVTSAFADDAEVKNAKYIDSIDTDWASGEDVVKRGIFQTDSDKYVLLNPWGNVLPSKNNATRSNAMTRDEVLQYAYGGTSGSAATAGAQYKIHNFGSDGARKTGTNTVEFTNDTYQLNTNASGDKGSGVFAKKYYQFGFLLKASADLKYGIYVASESQQLTAQQGSAYINNLQNGNYVVLTTSGSKQKGNNTAKKDADGNYWFIDKSDDTLKGIWTCNIKKSNITNFQLKGYWNLGANQSGVVATLSEILNTPVKLTLSSSAQSYTGADFVDQGVLNAVQGADNLKITPYSVTGETTWYTVKINSDTVAWQYQSDYENGSNKWIPFGVLDNAKKTPNLTWQSTPDQTHAYAVTPNTDYFVNAYWK